ncbi:MAG: hypothetical protein ACTSR3_03690 [Candidatus Helarchaeota archaeon]
MVKKNGFKKILCLVFTFFFIIQNFTILYKPQFNYEKILPLLLINNFSKENNKNLINSNLPEFLFINDGILSDLYTFYANGSAVFGAYIKKVDYGTNITIDNSEFELTYGYNSFPLKFDDISNIHTLKISEPEFVEKLFIQPHIIENTSINLETEQFTNISFHAGGLITILCKPILPFVFNDLYLQIDDILLKPLYDPDNVSIKIGKFSGVSELMSGRFIKYSIELDPAQHMLSLLGNGSLELLIVNEIDYDMDLMSTSEEIDLPKSFGFNPEIQYSMIFVRQKCFGVRYFQLEGSWTRAFGREKQKI